MSSADGAAAPSSIRTLHFLQVPWPPQVESMAMPFQLAASNTVTPAGTRTRRPPGSNSRSTRAGPAPARPASRACAVVTSRPAALDRGRALPRGLR